MKSDASKLRESHSGMVFSGSRKIPVKALVSPNGWQFLLLVLIGVCIYSGTLNHTFPFDSIQQIVENPYVRELKPCWEHTYKQDVLCPGKEEWEKCRADLDASLAINPHQPDIGPYRALAMKGVLNPQEPRPLSWMFFTPSEGDNQVSPVFLGIL